MPKYYRYEIYYGDEYTQKGLLNGIYYTDLNYYDCDDVMTPFYQELVSPEISPEMKVINPMFFFTEKGVEKFSDVIQKLDDMLKAVTDTIDNIRIVEVDAGQVKEKDIVYRDEFQIAVTESAYDRIKKQAGGGKRI